MYCHAVFNCNGHNHELTDNRLIKETVLKYVNESEFKDLFTITAFEKLETVTSAAIAATSSTIKASLDARNAVNDLTAQTIDFVNDAINNTAVEGGVLADTFVTATANGVGTVARTQRDKNAERITPYDFGVVGKLNTDKLSNRFSTLADAKNQYPNAVSLDELADRVAFDSFLLHLINNNCNGADWSCEVLVDKPLVSYMSAKTLQITGGLTLKPLIKDGVDSSALPYILHLATTALHVSGFINITGSYTSSADVQTRKSVNGVILGGFTPLGLTGSATHCVIDAIRGSEMLGFAFILGKSCHFTKIGLVRSSRSGSYLKSTGTKQNFGIVDNIVSYNNAGSANDQYCDIKVDSVRLPNHIIDTMQMTAIIDNKPYTVQSVDKTTNTVRVYPSLEDNVNAQDILYVFGGCVNATSNDTAGWHIGTVQSITSGSGLRLPTLYGGSVNSFISEYNGAAIIVSNRGDAHLGTVINLAYFEANNADILYNTIQNQFSALVINADIALNRDKIWNMYSFVSNGIRTKMPMASGRISADGRLTELLPNILNLHDHSSDRVYYAGNVSGTTTTAKLVYIPKIAELEDRKSKILRVSSNLGLSPFTLEAPTGYTLNGASSITVQLQEYVSGVIFRFDLNIVGNNIKVTYSGERKVKRGTTAQRPPSPTVGLRYYDTTLLASGKPIEWNGIEWVDSTGVTI